MKRLVLLTLLAAFVSGCATITLTRADSRTTVDIQNTAWYLFCCIPLGSGDPEAPNVKCCCWFRDKADTPNNALMLRDLCEREKSRAVNVETKYDDERILFILFKRIACNTSAELIRESVP